MTISVPVSPVTLTRRYALPAGQESEHLAPNLLIAGVTHSRATGLAAQLARHPEIKLPDAKRIDRYTPMRYGHPVRTQIADYDRHFASWTGQRYRLENSPVYFDGGRALVDAVARDLRGLRVLVLLRDPAERLWTSFVDKVERGRVPRAMGYETYVERCLALRSNGADRFECNRHFRTLSTGFYVEHLSGWLDAFGRRARVVFADDLEPIGDRDLDHDDSGYDAGRGVGAVYDWLGVDPSAVLPRPELEHGAVLEAYAPAARRRPWSVRSRLDGARARGTASRSRLWPRSERVARRVGTLYQGANLELAAVLRDRGYTALPPWLTTA